MHGPMPYLHRSARQSPATVVVLVLVVLVPVVVVVAVVVLNLSNPSGHSYDVAFRSVQMLDTPSAE